MDNFNGEIHMRLLPRLGENHSHLIPVEDYARLERAVADALRDTVGPDEARSLKVTCSPGIRQSSACPEPKRCCWRCVRFFQLSLIRYCSVAANCIQLMRQSDSGAIRFHR